MSHNVVHRLKPSCLARLMKSTRDRGDDQGRRLSSAVLKRSSSSGFAQPVCWTAALPGCVWLLVGCICLLVAERDLTVLLVRSVVGKSDGGDVLFVHVGKANGSSLSCNIAFTETMTCHQCPRSKAFWLKIEVALQRRREEKANGTFFFQEFPIFQYS